mgnify:CR=1 FL=1
MIINIKSTELKYFLVVTKNITRPRRIKQKYLLYIAYNSSDIMDIRV